MGGGHRRFPDTPGSTLARVGSDDAVVRARAFTSIAQMYWKPVYVHLRLRWRCANEEAKDLTQSFFARAFEKGTFATYDRGLARFRTFVKRCLDNYVRNHRDSIRAAKRGGGSTLLSLDTEELETRLAGLGELDDADREASFDAEWKRNLIAVSVAQLRESLERRGRGGVMEVFERYYPLEDVDDAPTYGRIAKELGVTVPTVANYLNAARKELRGLLLDNLREVTADDAEFELERREFEGA